MTIKLDLASFRGVRPGLALAIRDAGFKTPQDLWDHISSMNWAEGIRTGHYFKSGNALAHFKAALSVKGKFESDSGNKYFYYGNHNNYNHWADLIANVLGVDTEDLFGLCEQDINFGSYGEGIQITNAKSSQRKKLLKREDLIKILRALDFDGKITRQALHEFEIANYGLLEKPAPASHVEAKLEDIDFHFLFKMVLKSLKPEQRRLLARRYGLEGCKKQSARKIAEEFEVSAATVRNHLTRAEVLFADHPRARELCDHADVVFREKPHFEKTRKVKPHSKRPKNSLENSLSLI